MPARRTQEARPTFPQGLSLIEVCVAIAILAILLVNLSAVFNQGYRLLRKSKLSAMASFLAQDKMEELMHNRTFSLLGSVNNTTVLSAPYQDFTRQVNVTKPAAILGANATVNSTLAQINVKVSWNGSGGQRNFTLTSLVSNLSH